MIINRAYKFRVYPNKEQQEFIYNYYLEDKRQEYEQIKHSKTAYECIKDIPSLYEERPYLKEMKIKGYRNLKEIKGRIINATLSKENKENWLENSNNYYKCRQQLSRLYSKLKNARLYMAHKITENNRHI